MLLQTSIGVAGLLLVFIGFVYSRAETFASSIRADKYKNVARFGLVPFGLATLCGWLSLSVLNGDVGLYPVSVYVFRATLCVLLWYAFVVVFVYL